MQPDGDRRRNAFLNSPWVKVCLPIRPEREREAIEWLAEHMEGDIRLDLKFGPAADALNEIEHYRSAEKSNEVEKSKGIKRTPDYITLDSDVFVGDPALGSTDGPEALTPEQLYPILDTFDVTVPTDGFVYEQLLIGDEQLPTGGDQDDTGDPGDL